MFAEHKCNKQAKKNQGAELRLPLFVSLVNFFVKSVRDSP